MIESFTRPGSYTLVPNTIWVVSDRPAGFWDRRCFLTPFFVQHIRESRDVILPTNSFSIFASEVEYEELSRTPFTANAWKVSESWVRSAAGYGRAVAGSTASTGCGKTEAEN